MVARLRAAAIARGDDGNDDNGDDEVEGSVKMTVYVRVR